MAEYVFPIAGPCSYVDRHWDGYKAVDMFCAKGTPLVAVTAGKSVITNYPLGGHTAMLYGDDGRVYYYAHMISGSGVPGRLQAGAQIGLADNTGNAATTPTHLHFSMSTQDYGIDGNGAGNIAPWPLLRQWQAGIATGGEVDELSAAEKAELEQLRKDSVYYETVISQILPSALGTMEEFAADLAIDCDAVRAKVLEQCAAVRAQAGI